MDVLVGIGEGVGLLVEVLELAGEFVGIGLVVIGMVGICLGQLGLDHLGHLERGVDAVEDVFVELAVVVMVALVIRVVVAVLLVVGVLVMVGVIGGFEPGRSDGVDECRLGVRGLGQGGGPVVVPTAVDDGDGCLGEGELVLCRRLVVVRILGGFGDDGLHLGLVAAHGSGN